MLDTTTFTQVGSVTLPNALPYQQWAELAVHRRRRDGDARVLPAAADHAGADHRHAAVSDRGGHRRPHRRAARSAPLAKRGGAPLGSTQGAKEMAEVRQDRGGILPGSASGGRSVAVLVMALVAVLAAIALIFNASRRSAHQPPPASSENLEPARAAARGRTPAGARRRRGAGRRRQRGHRPPAGGDRARHRRPAAPASRPATSARWSATTAWCTAR